MDKRKEIIDFVKNPDDFNTITKLIDEKLKS
jgi:deoxyadenosine/deoxycytidine kinase